MSSYGLARWRQNGATRVPRVLVATWNVNSLKARLERVELWLADVAPDVVCLQETKLADDAFPALTFSALGYESVHLGQGQWNGVAILSKVGIEDPVFGFAPGIEPDTDARLVSATCGGVRVHSVYVPNGRAVDHEHYHYKLSWLDRLRAHLDQTCQPSDDVVVAGDWNIIPTDLDVWDPAAFIGMTHVTPPERDALARIVDWGLADPLRARYGDQPGLFSYYDYTAGRFPQASGDADRLRVGHGRPGRALDPGPHRPQRPQGHQAQRPRPGAGRLCPMTGPDRESGDRAAAPSELPSFLQPVDPATVDRHRRLTWRVGDRLREIIERLVGTQAPDDDLEQAADDLERLARGLERFEHGRRYDAAEAATAGGGPPEGHLDFSPLVGRANPLAPPLELSVEPDRPWPRVVGTVTFGSAYEGPPGCVHGGIVAAAFDEVMGAVQAATGQPGMTGTLTVVYRSPTPLHAQLRFEASVERIEGRKIHVGATVGFGDRLCAEATAIFISVDFEALARLQQQRDGGAC